MKKDDCVLNYCFVLAEKGIRVGICHSVYQYAKANNKHMKDYDKLSYIQYWNVNNLYRWKMLQKLPANTFEKIKDTSQFNDDFIKKVYWWEWWRVFSRSWYSKCWKITWTS